jgi:hypothetical protein
VGGNRFRAQWSATPVATQDEVDDVDMIRLAGSSVRRHRAQRRGCDDFFNLPGGQVVEIGRHIAI